MSENDQGVPDKPIKVRSNSTSPVPVPVPDNRDVSNESGVKKDQPNPQSDRSDPYAVDGFKKAKKKPPHYANLSDDPTTITPIPADKNLNKLIHEQYFGKANIEEGSVSRVPLLYSGKYITLTSYKNIEILNIHRKVSDANFLDQLNVELTSLFDKTISTSDNKLNDDYGEWLDSIKGPDKWQIYFGSYGANNFGVNTYEIRCQYCGQTNSHSIDNKDLSYIDPKCNFGQHEIDQIMKGVHVNKIKSYVYASTPIKMEKLTPISKWGIEFTMPSIKDELIYMYKITNSGKASPSMVKALFYPFSHVRSGIVDLDEEISLTTFMVHKILMHVSKITVPVDVPQEGGGVETEYVEITDKMEIFELIDTLQIDDIRHITSSKEVRNMIYIQDGLQTRIHGIKCKNPKCSSNIAYVNINMRDMLFTKAAEVIAISDQE